MFPVIQWLIVCVALYYSFKFACWLHDRAERSG